MKLLMTLCFSLVACGGTKPAQKTAIGTEGSDTPESCCCKSTPATSEDGKPVYEMANRMECSTRQGECMPDVQCSKSDSPAPSSSSSLDNPPPPPPQP